MGRSVNYLHNASRITYISLDSSEDEFESEMIWKDLEDNITCELQSLFPSLQMCKRWDNNETRIFLHNYLVEIGLSEYCGLVSVSIRPSSYYEANTGLAEHWINQNWDKAEAKMAEFSTTLRKVGTFSNGCGVFEKVS